MSRPVILAAVVVSVTVLAPFTTPGPADTPLAGLESGPDEPSVGPPNPAWAAFAYPVTEDLEAGDVNIEITFTWQDPKAGDGRLMWTCAYAGGDPMDRPPYPAKSGCRFQSRDRAYEATVRSGDRSVHVGHADPVCSAVACHGDEIRRTFSLKDWLQDGNVYDDHRRVGEDTAYFLVTVGSRPPDDVDVEVNADGTNVTARYGSHAETFTYFRKDFEAAAYVEAGTPYHGPYYQHGNATLETALLDDPSRQVAFWYWWGPWWYPNGTSMEHIMTPVVSDQIGRWQFADEGGLGRHGQDLPMLVGSVVDLPDPD